MKIPERYWTGKPLLAAGLPWLTPGALEAIERLLNPSFDVLEFGAGGSTIYFSRRCQSVTTWEPNAAWRRKIYNRLDGPPNVLMLRSLTRALSPSRTYDLVLVDSHGGKTDRDWITKRAVNLVRPGGWFILDNYGRYRLAPVIGWFVQFYDDPHWSGLGTLIAQSP